MSDVSTYVCPVCGSPELSVTVLISAKQDLNGDWSLVIPEAYDPESIKDEVVNPNNEVTCLNPFCGTTYDVTGKPINEKELENLVQTYCERQGIELEEYTDAALQKYSEEIFEHYKDWRDGIYHMPWRGVVGDCNKID